MVTLTELIKLVEDTPNNMELGKKVRLLYWDFQDKQAELKEKQLDIFESPDGGKTIYKRKSGDYDNRTKVSEE